MRRVLEEESFGLERWKLEKKEAYPGGDSSYIGAGTRQVEYSRSRRRRAKRRRRPPHKRGAEDEGDDVIVSWRMLARPESVGDKQQWN